MKPLLHRTMSDQQITGKVLHNLATSKTAKTKRGLSLTQRVPQEYMKVLRPCLHFHGIQIKSDEAFRRFAKAVAEIEEVCGIHSTTISLEDPFVCPDIGIDEDWFQPVTSMEQLLTKLIRELK